MKTIRCAVLFIIALFCVGYAEAHTSKAWQERLAAYTTRLWVEGQKLGDGLVLYSRATVEVVWLDRRLSRHLNRDRDIDEWFLSGLSYYSSIRKETREKMKRRDVFAVNCRASKNWNFDPTKLVIGGYKITSNDILTGKYYWDSELSPGEGVSIAVAAPSIKPGDKIEIRYEEESAAFEAPKK